MALTPREARIARAALRLSLRHVARETGLTARTVGKFEAGGGVLYRTAVALEAFYRAAGIGFPREDVVDASTLPAE